MSAKIISNFEGIVTAKITGLLNYEELLKLQESVFNIIAQLGKIKALIICEDFQGWSKEGDWGELSFQNQTDPYINKMAIVGDRQWEELAMMFTGKGLREFPIEYFQTEELDKAEAWLREN
ncbi:MAG: STAS/SEC14 domain-containing protein [Methylobacter sp.]